MLKDNRCDLCRLQQLEAVRRARMRGEDPADQGTFSMWLRMDCVGFGVQLGAQLRSFCTTIRVFILGKCDSVERRLGSAVRLAGLMA
jgi:hypothetical protein